MMGSREVQRALLPITKDSGVPDPEIAERRPAGGVAAGVLTIAIRLLVGMTAEAGLGSLQPSGCHTWSLCKKLARKQNSVGTPEPCR